MQHQLPEIGFLRERQILGDKNAKPPTPAIIPVSHATWWRGCKSGIYPAPLKLSSGVTVWKASEIRALLSKLGEVAQ